MGGRSSLPPPNHLLPLPTLHKQHGGSRSVPSVFVNPWLVLLQERRRSEHYVNWGEKRWGEGRWGEQGGELSGTDTDSEVRFDALHTPWPSPWLPPTCAIDVSNHISGGLKEEKQTNISAVFTLRLIPELKAGAAGTGGGAGRLKQVESDDSSSRKRRSCFLMVRCGSDETDCRWRTLLSKSAEEKEEEEEDDRCVCTWIQKKKKTFKKCGFRLSKGWSEGGLG